MATLPTFKYSEDPLYDLSSKTVMADQSTQFRQLRRIDSPSSSSASFASPLKQDEIQFQISNGSNSRIRLDTSCLCMQIYLTNAEGNGLPTSAGIPWNLFGEMIQSISLNINDQSDNIFDKVKGDYKHHFTSTMLKTFSLQDLNNLGQFVFTPVGAKEYSVQLAKGALYDLDTIQTIGGTSMTAKKKSDDFTLVTGNADSVRTIYTIDGEQKERFKNALPETDSYKTPITLRVPWSIVFGFGPCLPRNIWKIMIKMQLSCNSDGKFVNLLEDLSKDTARAHVRCTKVWCELDTYIPAISEITQAIADKKSGTPDIISIMDTDVKYVTLNSVGKNQLSFIGQRNVDSILIYQRAAECTSGSSDADAVIYTSVGEFSIGNMKSYAAANSYIKKADHASIATAGEPIDDISITYGHITYPPQPLSLTSKDSAGTNNIFDPSAAYAEYLKATGRYPYDMTGAISYNLFRSVMPFVMLSPWSRGNGIHISKEAVQLDVSITRPSQHTSNKFVICISKLKTAYIAADSTGHVSQN